MNEKDQLIFLDGTNTTIQDMVAIAKKEKIPAVAKNTLEKLSKSRAMLEDMAESNTPIYGVTTGFGEMVYASVSKEHETALQENLVRSHCAGVGKPFEKVEARAMMAARINALCKGFSAVRPQLVEQLLRYLNQDIIPFIPEVGSLGASGDLAPLAHIAITLMGEGYVLNNENQKIPTSQVLKQKGIQPLSLKFKEGLALINGTSAMTGLASLVSYEAAQQIQKAEIVTALALEALHASRGAFQEEGHNMARPHLGQIDCATNIRTLIHGSHLIATHENLIKAMKQATSQTTVHKEEEIYIQKAYTLRCIPQIIGAIRDTLYHAQKVLYTEINSANDNPLFFEEKTVFHGGNFHGQPIAFAMDFLTIALTQMGVVSERRTNRLLNRYLSSGLSEFLVTGKPGLQCGFAGAQYPATALVAENRARCIPSSIQSIPSNADNQDVVSMGLTATRHTKNILKNNYYILAIEYLAAAQAIDLKKCSQKLSKANKIAYETLRKLVKPLKEDRYMSDDINRVRELLEQEDLLKNLAQANIHLK